MKHLVDVVNFNADASSLSASTWLKILEGNEHSSFCKWLDAYATHGKQMVLGLTGATVADLAILNPEAIHFINAHPQIFQLILRPFAHDIALLRSQKGFQINFNLGIKTIEREFQNVIRYFLPPEFMLTGQQIHFLAERKVPGTFVNPQRFSDDVRRRLPQKPYTVRGVLGSRLTCIPCDGTLTSAYLEALYRFDVSRWNRILADHVLNTVFSWRDGESPFLVPDGLEREIHWLQAESEEILRCFIPENPYPPPADASPEPGQVYSSYPIHSFTAWMKEFRMLGYIQRIQAVELGLDRFAPGKLAVWLSAIGSDVLSAVEKRDRTIRLFSENRVQSTHHRIMRSERGFEGEDYLTILESLIQEEPLPYLTDSEAPHMKKLRARMAYLERLLN